MNEKDKCIIHFLNKCHIFISEFKDLEGLLIPRDMFLDKTKFINLSEDILKLKKNIYSTGLTAFQKDADKNQKWPLLNIVRQLLKTKGYKMTPGRKSNGYTLEGKKKYTRHFIIHSIKPKNEYTTTIINEQNNK